MMEALSVAFTPVIIVRARVGRGRVGTLAVALSFSSGTAPVSTPDTLLSAVGTLVVASSFSSISVWLFVVVLSSIPDLPHPNSVGARANEG